MSPSSSGSWLDRMVGACLSVLVAAVAISVAVHLITAVWTTLLVIGSLIIAIAVGIAVWRERSRGW